MMQELLLALTLFNITGSGGFAVNNAVTLPAAQTVLTAQVETGTRSGPGRTDEQNLQEKNLEGIGRSGVRPVFSNEQEDEQESGTAHRGLQRARTQERNKVITEEYNALMKSMQEEHNLLMVDMEDLVRQSEQMEQEMQSRMKQLQQDSKRRQMEMQQYMEELQQSLTEDMQDQDATQVKEIETTYQDGEYVLNIHAGEQSAKYTIVIEDGEITEAVLGDNNADLQLLTRQLIGQDYPVKLKLVFENVVDREFNGITQILLTLAEMGLDGEYDYDVDEGLQDGAYELAKTNEDESWKGYFSLEVEDGKVVSIGRSVSQTNGSAEDRQWQEAVEELVEKTSSWHEWDFWIDPSVEDGSYIEQSKDNPYIKAYLQLGVLARLGITEVE